MESAMLSVQQASESIRKGKRLLLAGEESLLAQLPQGEWIGGTTPYFMTDKIGICTREQLFAINLPDVVTNISITELDESDLPDIYAKMSGNGFGIVIIPAGSTIHSDFAMNAPYYDAFATMPLIGWISGSHVSEIGKVTPAVFSGASASSVHNKAVVLYAELPTNLYAEMGILNLFEPGDGDRITFDAPGFSARGARINGREQSLASYIVDKGIDTRLPLVADYCGAMINISFQNVDTVADQVSFYAPVFPGVSYRHARVVPDYVSAFVEHMPRDGQAQMAFSCNCILNYLYSELEGKSTGGIAGPITFGEIAYQLLNQTMVYLTIGSV